MKDFKIIKSDIDKGYEFVIETIDKEDYRTVKVGLSTRLKKYYIIFNGMLIHTCKGFQSVIYTLNKLDEKFHLENDSNYN